MSMKKLLFGFGIVFLALAGIAGIAYGLKSFNPKPSTAKTEPPGMPMSDDMEMAATGTPSPVPLTELGCDIQDYTLDSPGAGAPFTEPDPPTTRDGVTILKVQYGDNKIGQCAVHLRSYNGKLVGPTLRARPGDTLRITLDNQLPVEDMSMPHVMNTIGDLNHTNLHTHGLHVSPAGNSDNVLLDIAPGQTFEYEIKIPPNQVPGTFWYHAHLHGSTATQLASGMEGALIVMGDQITDPAYPPSIDQIPAIKAATEKIFVFQQIIYDENGMLEPDAGGGAPTTSFPSYKKPADKPNWPDQLSYFGPCNWEPMKREHLINGLLFPKLNMAPGEVQRWRFIDAGIRESIGVQLVGPYDLGANITRIDQVYDTKKNQPVAPGKFVQLNEIAVDGIPLYKVDAWSQVELEPGYRSDVMVQINQPGKYYLIDTGIVQQTVTTNPLNLTPSPTATAGPTQTQTSFSLTCPPQPGAPLEEQFESPNFLATVVVSGQAKKMKLPTTTEMAALKKPDILKDIIKIDQSQNPYNEAALVAQEPIDSFQKVDFTVALHPASFVATATGNPTSTPFPQSAEFMAADHPFDLQNPRRLLLGNTDEWILNTQPDSLYYAHPFHIHVNAFQTWRASPDANGYPTGPAETVWRDTILVPQGVTIYAFTRYTDYIGQYVYHCHILDHEDQGMMELVEIVNRPAPTATPQP